MRKPILVVIDMINDSFGEQTLGLKDRLVAPLSALVDFFHAKDLPVVWVRQEFEPDLADAFLDMRKHGTKKYIRNTVGAQIIDELKPQVSDPILVKKRYSAFHGTDLESWLLHRAPDAVILAGVNTHACIRTTAIDAYQRDLNVVLAGDCIGSYDEEHHRVSHAYMDGKIATVLSNEEIFEALGRPE